VCVPLIISICKRRGWFDTVDTRKVHNGNVPRLGSLGFVPVFFAVSVIYLLFTNSTFLLKALPVFIPAFALFLFGLLDDFKELRARVKLCVQIAISLVPVLCGLHFTNLGQIQFGMWGYVITVVYLIGFINAFNLIDGVDALCAGISLGISLSLGILYSFSHSSAQSALMYILASSLASFLFFNKPKAKIFMGDGGSQFLGFTLACLPLLPSDISIEYNKLPMMLILASIPMLDTISAIWRRTRERRLFFLPDNGHIHHKFLNMGYTVRSILTFLLMIQFGLCVTAIISVHYVRYIRGLFVLCAAFAAMCMFFAIIHYTNRAVSRVKTQAELEGKLSAYPTADAGGTPKQEDVRYDESL
jgi:UDP-GlcNAc:undecaprenyl-phosphate GlcNAc-1-phosphate transferase